jgi:hypothetical protein
MSGKHVLRIDVAMDAQSVCVKRPAYRRRRLSEAAS